MKQKKLRIGITGGIGSGKSTLAEVFKEEGFRVINADAEAKELLAKDPEIKKKIISAFSSEAYLNGVPNVQYLSKVVFNNEKNVVAINSIIHPAVIEIIAKKSEEILKKDSIVFVEAALIYEARMEDLFDFIILVVASEKNKIARVVKRDNCPEKAVIRRMSFQIEEKIKKEFADFTIQNDSTFEEFLTKGKFLLNLYKSMVE